MEQISAIWDEMGLDEGERKSQTKQLSVAVSSVFSDKLKEEETLKEEYTAVAASMISKIDRMENVLKLNEIKDREKLNSISLLPKLAYLRDTHQKLNDVQNERIKRLDSMRESVRKLSLKVGEEVEDDLKSEVFFTNTNGTSEEKQKDIEVSEEDLIEKKYKQYREEITEQKITLYEKEEIRLGRIMRDRRKIISVKTF